jgi:hypothetical protein
MALLVIYQSRSSSIIIYSASADSVLVLEPFFHSIAGVKSDLKQRQKYSPPETLSAFLRYSRFPDSHLYSVIADQLIPPA